MTKDEAKAALLAGGHMIYSRASMGSPASARINGQPLRSDTAGRLIIELGLRPDKPVGVTKTYRLPQPEAGAAPEEAPGEASNAPTRRTTPSP